MCEILSLGFLDAILSLVIFVMNIIYCVWGWFIPDDPNREGEAMNTSGVESFGRSAAREEFSQHMEKLKSYLNFVTYSDSLALPVKILIMFLIQYFVCRKKRLKNEGNTNDNVDSTSNTNIKGSSIPGAEHHDNSEVSKFHLPNLFNFNVIPQRKKNIVEV